MADPPVAGESGMRHWIALAVLALPCAVYAMDLTVLNLAVPALSADLAPSGVQLLWIVDVYGFFVAGLLVTMGALGDRVGRRRVLLIGAGLFAVASVAAATAPSAGWLIAARALLGVAGATLGPSTLALIRTMFDDPGRRSVAIGIWITSFSAGAAVGPLVGGVLLERFWWGSVFLPAVPVMVLVLVLGPVLLPEYRAPGSARIDLPSASMALTAVLAVIYGLKEVAQSGTSALAVLAVAAGALLAILFGRRQRRLRDPLIDLRLFRVPAFSVALGAYTLGFFVNFGSLLFVSQYLQLVLGQAPFTAGLWTVPGALAIVVGSLLTPSLLRALRPSALLRGGLLVGAAGYAVLLLVGGGGGLAAVVVGTVVGSLGLSVVFTVATDVIVAAAPPERAGAASAISETGSELGGAVGIAVMGALATAVYRYELADLAGVPPATLWTARGTLGAAAAVAGELDEPLGAALLSAARAAFVTGFQLAVGVGVGVLLIAAALAHHHLHRRSRAHVPAEVSS